tara:strand:- start:2136 stop:2909 length:774 start_codon:yes stop_codon:yes gene_type:complete
MKIKVTKSHGTENSFIIIYNNQHHQLLKTKIQDLCKLFDTDGFLLLSDHDDYDFQMDYFNNDGSWETMCANGARCAALFMFHKKKCTTNIKFITGDGPHKIKIKNSNDVKLSMRKPIFKTTEIKPFDYYGRFIDSGAKHFVTIVNQIDYNIVKYVGLNIRNNKLFESYGGVNVNFLTIINSNHIQVYTYEKGIEDMVMSCGSGSVAAAYYAFEQNKIKSPVQISVPGGELKLTFNDNWSDVWLSGPAHLESEEDVEL